MSALDTIYQQTVTVFNKKIDGDSFVWYPTVLTGVHLVTQKAVMVNTFGDSTSDNAMLHVRYKRSNGGIYVQGKEYLLPKTWQAKSKDEVSEYITFQNFEGFDFIWQGVWDGDSSISDDDYKSGFYHYMNTTYDLVFAITNVSRYDYIPHFEITAQ